MNIPYAIEYYLTQKLKCGTADLFLMELLDTRLAEECTDTSSIIENNITLCDIMLDLFYNVSKEVGYYAYDILANSSKRNLRKVLKFGVHRRLRETQITAIKEKLTHITNGCDVYFNYVASDIGGELSEVIDWDKDKEYNAIQLLKRLFKTTPRR